MRRFVLAGNEQTGFIAGENTADLPPIGSIGEVFSTLRPSGKIVIDDKLYDAISYGTYIEKGSKILVERFEGSTIVVNKREE